MDNAKSQIITLTDRKQLSLTGVEKMISVKPDLLQLNTDFGTLQITGTAMEVSKLDLEEKVLEVKGVINSIKYSIARVNYSVHNEGQEKNSLQL